MNRLQQWFPYNYKNLGGERQCNNFYNSYADGPLQVFCFPSAGSGAQLYRTWREKTKDQPCINFIPVEIPGRGNHIHRPAATSIDELLADFLPVFADVVQGSYVLYGHSFGALVAFLLAHSLQENGFLPPEKLIVAGRHAPHMHDPSLLNSASTDAEITAELKKMGGTPAVLLNHPEMLQFTLQQLRGDLRTHESFHYCGQKLQIPVEAHCGMHDDADLTVMDYWREVTAGSFQIQEFFGHHFFIQSLGDIYLKNLLKTLNNTYKSSH
ncbi:thioesterase II family protein [Sphingobacterium sp. Mn56C]|uniref:thioesterase II family protein n=1 Tax=Sphingobacterium sp. Mn56C TaxID=3395261 RepID=UPI003BDA8438